MEKSFCVDQKTKMISIYAGDTGSMTVKVRGYDFESTDRALFTVAEKDGEIILSREYEIVDNTVVVEFRSEDTNFLDPRNDYEWDMRYIVNPQRDESGKIIDRDAVSTPGSPFRFKVKGTKGRNV